MATKTTNPFSLAVSPMPVAEDEMNETPFNAMIARGLREAKEDKSRVASDVFVDLKRDMHHTAEN